jgi:hypothetical protein
MQPLERDWEEEKQDDSVFVEVFEPQRIEVKVRVYMQSCDRYCIIIRLRQCTCMVHTFQVSGARHGWKPSFTLDYNDIGSSAPDGAVITSVILRYVLNVCPEVMVQCYALFYHAIVFG